MTGAVRRVVALDASREHVERLRDPGLHAERTRELARVLEPVEDVRVTDNIRGQLWSKLLVNSALSGLGVVGGCTYGDVAAHPEGRQAIFEVWSEGYEIGMAQGLSLETVLGIEPVSLASADERTRSAALDVVTQHAAATRAS